MRPLTHPGIFPQVGGTRWHKSLSTLMTITQDCSPLARAFGEGHEKKQNNQANIHVKTALNLLINFQHVSLEAWDPSVYLEPLGMTESCQVLQTFLLVQKVSRVLRRHLCWRQHILCLWFAVWTRHDRRKQVTRRNRCGVRSQNNLKGVCLSRGAVDSLICRDRLAWYWRFLCRQDGAR